MYIAKIGRFCEDINHSTTTQTGVQMTLLPVLVKIATEYQPKHGYILWDLVSSVRSKIIAKPLIT